MEHFTLEDIYSDKSKLEDYINQINYFKGNSLELLREYAATKIPELNELPKTEFKPRDKGGLGKYIELYLFGNTPNSISEPDLKKHGIDIKVTRFKILKKSGLYNAKERLTICNVGNTNDYSTFKDIVNNIDLKNTKAFKKMKDMILVGFTLDNTFIGVTLIYSCDNSS